MKCTSKICYEHFIEMPSLGVGLICHAMSLHPQSRPNIPRSHKYVQNNNMKSPPRHLVAKCDTISGHCNEKPHFVMIC